MQAQLAETEQSEITPAPTHLAYLPGLNGVRALAVIAVLLYHADLGVYGGYLGVESFFVLSGFLITTLLLLDVRNHGRVGLKSFWLRRALRLLPALLVMLAGTLAITAILLPDELTSLTGDTLAALAYVMNWHLIASGQSYFDAAARPPLLQHLWSLAIEEQFYLIWPLLFAVSMRFLRRRGTLALVLLAAAASATLMWWLYDPGTDPSRIYYGTDTRAGGLLLGVALALAWRPGPAGAQPRRVTGIALDSIGLLALGGLLAAYVLLQEQHPLLYRGGLALVALGTAVVVAATTHPQARLLPWLLELPPLRWIGLRSYGIYLWHWPIFMLTRPGVDVALDGWQLQVLRFALVLGVAALSYTFVELPIRAGALGRLWLALRKRTTNADASAPIPSTQAVVDTSGAASTSMLAAFGQIARRSQRWHRRWASAIAASVLALGVTYITISVAHSAVRSTQLDQAVVASTPAGTTTPPTATAHTASTPSAVASTAATASTPESDQIVAPTPAAEAEPAFDPALAEQLQHILDSTVADGAIPGAVLSVRLPDGTTWSGASGLAERGTNTAMTPDTRVRVGSLSKIFTAVVVLQLVEEGTVNLDAPLATWLPDMVPHADTITVRDLLQHTSGLYDYLEDRRFVSQAYENPQRVWKPEELVEYAADFPASFTPGAKGKWDYSSTNYVILGMIIERTTGNPLEQELRQRIFEPLNLRATYAVPADTVTGPQAHGYSKSDDQTAVAMSFTFGSANIVTTVDDLQTFGMALFAGDLLEDATRAQMQQFVNGKGQYNMPNLEYGLGLMGNQIPIATGQAGKAEKLRVIGHIGGFGGFRAAMWYAPEDGTLVTLSVNQASTDPNTLAMQVFGAISGSG